MAKEAMKRPNPHGDQTHPTHPEHVAAASDSCADHSTSRPGIVAFGCVLLIRGYQATLGPLMGGHCRFHPTCSAYAIEAYRAHGVARGSWLTVKRLLKCHPFSRRCGFDPVPQAGDDSST